MSYLGSWKIDDALTFPANTHAASTGAATDADSVPSYRVYEDETGTALLTGSMAKLDDANTVGFYTEQVTLSAANGFEKGKCYTIYISAAVSSTTGTMSHTFQIEAEVDANVVSDKSSYNLAADQSGVTVGTVNALGTQAKADVNAEADTALTDYDPPTHAELVSEINDVQSDIAGLNDLDAAGVRTAIGLASANLDTQLSTIDTVVDAIKVVTDALGSTAAANLALSAAGIVGAAAQTGTLSTTQMTTNLTEATDDHYNGRVVIFTSGDLSGQVTDITDYTGSTKLITMTALTEPPSNGDTFVIV